MSRLVRDWEESAEALLESLESGDAAEIARCLEVRAAWLERAAARRGQIDPRVQRACVDRQRALEVRVEEMRAAVLLELRRVREARARIAQGARSDPQSRLLSQRA